jgi:hypothetical protein
LPLTGRAELKRDGRAGQVELRTASALSRDDCDRLTLNVDLPQPIEHLGLPVTTVTAR